MTGLILKRLVVDRDDGIGKIHGIGMHPLSPPPLYMPKAYVY